MAADLPLLEWRPSCSLHAFPLDRRASKIRDVARKMLTKTTDAHIEQFTGQVSDALRRHLSKINTDPVEQNRQLTLFWSKVDLEIALLTYRGSTGNNPKGAA